MESHNNRDGALAATSRGTANSDEARTRNTWLHRSNDARTRLLNAAGTARKIELANQFGVRPALFRRAWCGSYLSARRTLDVLTWTALIELLHSTAGWARMRHDGHTWIGLLQN